MSPDLKSKSHARPLRSGLILAAVLLQAACSGGGSGSTPQAVSPNGGPAPQGAQAPDSGPSTSSTAPQPPAGSPPAQVTDVTSRPENYQQPVSEPSVRPDAGDAPAPGSTAPTPVPTPAKPGDEAPRPVAPIPIAAKGATDGAFGPVIDWPLIAIHMSLLPDGRIVYYGSDTQGRQDGKQNYAVWDPAQGNVKDAHTLYENPTGTDLFCSGQSFIASTNQLLMTGGDQTFGYMRNYAIPDVTLFDASSNQMSKAPQMTQRRWYPSVVATAQSEMVVLGGYTNTKVDEKLVTGSAKLPEVYNPRSGWRRLDTASSDDAWGDNNWFYPRGFAAPDGSVFVVSDGGDMFSLDVAQGTVRPHAARAESTIFMTPTANYATGKLLSVRHDRIAQVIDFSGTEATVSNTASVSAIRNWSTMTVLPDGKVLLTGGSPVDMKIEGASMQTETWDPATGQWTLGAAASLPRIYHSNALLLPDASVVVAGGGAPGPLTNTNAEIYYPPYLYRKDGSGQPNSRPWIMQAPKMASYGQSASIRVESPRPIGKLVLVRHGSSTHAYNSDQRRIEVPFTQQNDSLQFAMPADRNVAIPGYYMLFAIDSEGVPSVAKTVRLDG